MLVAAVVIFAAMNLACTVLRHNVWPFCSYDMFADRARPFVWTTAVTLVNARGTEYVADPSSVLPIEFFRARALVGSVFGGGTLPHQAELAQLIIDTVNHQEWHAFDEIRASSFPAAARPAIALRISRLCRRTAAAGAGGAVISYELLFETPR